MQPFSDNIFLKDMARSIKQIFEEDQSERMSGVGWDTLSINDKKRRSEIQNILTVNKKLTAEDLYYAAMIYHHSGNQTETKKALILAKRSAKISCSENESDLWCKKSKWLIASATDRLLLFEGKPQKYGTQYWRKNADALLELAPYDKSTTDVERMKFNVLPLESIFKEIEALNKEQKFTGVRH